MSRFELIEKMKSVLIDVSDSIDWGRISEKDDLSNDLGFDSLTMMLVAIKLEDTFGIEIPDSIKFKTVRDVCDFVEAQV